MSRLEKRKLKKLDELYEYLTLLDNMTDNILNKTYDNQKELLKRARKIKPKISINESFEGYEINYLNCYNNYMFDNDIFEYDNNFIEYDTDIYNENNLIYYYNQLKEIKNKLLKNLFKIDLSNYAYCDRYILLINNIFRRPDCILYAIKDILKKNHYELSKDLKDWVIYDDLLDDINNELKDKIDKKYTKTLYYLQDYYTINKKINMACYIIQFKAFKTPIIKIYDFFFKYYKKNLKNINKEEEKHIIKLLSICNIIKLNSKYFNNVI